MRRKRASDKNPSNANILRSVLEYDLIFGGLRIEGRIRQMSDRYYRKD